MQRRRVDVGEGLELAYAETGAGPPVILIHGSLTLLEDMMLGLSALGSDHRLLAFDRPGHGGSQRHRLSEAGPWRQAALIHRAAQALGIERPILVGHSFGGSVAMAYALAYPADTAGVVALAPIVLPEIRLEHFLFAPRWPPGVGDWLGFGPSAATDKALLPILWRAMFVPQTPPEYFRQRFPYAMAGRPEVALATGEDAMAALGDLAKSLARYPRCEPPVRVFGGDMDLVVNNSLHGRRLADLAPNGRFRALPGLGHMIHHFAADEIAEAVKELQAIEAGVRSGVAADAA